jgi:xylan 1,4-beta-xylosidase
VLRAPRLILRFFVLLLGVVLALSVRAAAAQDAVAPVLPKPPSLSWNNPVIADDFPDPSVVRDGDTFWATSTSSAAGPGFPLMRSTDLVHWTPAGTIFSRLPAWAADSFWAPEIFIDPAGVRVYYAARKRGGRLCVAVATAPNVAGPYTDHGPLVCQRAGSIDPTRTRDQYGRLFLVWKEDGNAIGRPSVIWRQRLSPDGLKLVGRPLALLRNRDPWEGGVVEAPSIVVRGGWTYLFYSGNSYGPPKCRYALGVARARSLRGPWQRAPSNPILRSSAAWRCPGHASFVTDDDGRDFVVYHAYRATDSPLGARYGLLDRVHWGTDGWPSVAAGRGPSIVADADDD